VSVTVSCLEISEVCARTLTAHPYKLTISDVGIIRIQKMADPGEGIVEETVEFTVTISGNANDDDGDDNPANGGISSPLGTISESVTFRETFRNAVAKTEESDDTVSLLPDIKDIEGRWKRTPAMASTIRDYLKLIS
jgi:hypothetical protein